MSSYSYIQYTKMLPYFCGLSCTFANVLISGESYNIIKFEVKVEATKALGLLSQPHNNFKRILEAYRLWLHVNWLVILCLPVYTERWYLWYRTIVYTTVKEADLLLISLRRRPSCFFYLDLLDKLYWERAKISS